MRLFMRFPGGKTKTLTFSYDDNVIEDIRLIELFKKYGLKGTFNINTGMYSPREGFAESPSHTRLTRQQAIALYKDSGFEVASHGVTHPFMTQIPAKAATADVMLDIVSIEKDYGTFVRGYAYPYGAYNEEVKNILKNCGIVYARTVNSSHGFDIPTDWLELRPTCHHDDEKLFELADRFNFAEVHRAPLMFYIWGHGYEFKMNNNWDRIEKIAEMLSGRDDTWYATNIEIYDYIDAYKRLIFDSGVTKVYNPTVTDIWFELDDKIFKVSAGETLAMTK
ncbi:MAG: polysaccharide deacetylase family protein [Lachnospiraceae bacterium]|nr:polysaccharide deacetylase family protein [Lachnospiraceae bacterium]